MTPLRIMTANLWGHNVDPTGLATTLQDVDPDVLVVQELEIAASEVIASRFDHRTLDPIGEAMGSGAATRHPATISRLPLRYRSGWSIVLGAESWPLEQPIEIIGIHMANAMAWPWWQSVGHRRLQLAGLLAHCAAVSRRRVIVGDFNASPAWPLYKQMAARFVDGAVATRSARPTWRLRGLTPPLLRIDHAFGHGLRFLDVQAVVVPGADHLALVADVAP